MSSVDDAIEKLLRRIQRAASKNKLKKVDRLTKQLNQLQAVASAIEEQETLNAPSDENNIGNEEEEEEEENDKSGYIDDNGEYVHEEESRDVIADHH
tara:strand:+ start:450 stop:740 length:291 start_codon:yes stop_codon:yes gene_type:complete